MFFVLHVIMDYFLSLYLEKNQGCIKLLTHGNALLKHSLAHKIQRYYAGHAPTMASSNAFETESITHKTFFKDALSVYFDQNCLHFTF